MSRRKPAPLYNDTAMLCDWVLDRLGDDFRALPFSICNRAIALHEEVAMALTGHRQEHHIDLADETLTRLRALLRIAARQSVLSDAQVIHALDRADSIGRQIGGWLRAQGPI